MLSVVVPVHRVEAYLPQCLDSILAHLGDDIEVIAVDDASPDGCGQILDRYAAADERLHVMHLAVNVGLGQARNAGLDAASGTYVWFVDSDDWLPAGAVESVIERLTAGHPDVLVIDHAEVLDGELVVKPTLAQMCGEQPPPLRLEQCPRLLRLAQSACTKIFRREFANEIGLRFPPGWYEDTYFSHLLLVAASSIDLLPAYSYCYRLRTPGSITSTLSDRHYEVFAQYERLFADVERLAPDLPPVVRGELFRMMLCHYFVILGNPWRLPANERRRFFARIAREYADRYPEGGYSRPLGAEGLKHWLASRRAYLLYAGLRRVHLVVTGGRWTPHRDKKAHPELVPAQRTASDVQPECTGRTGIAPPRSSEDRSRRR